MAKQIQLGSTSEIHPLSVWMAAWEKTEAIEFVQGAITYRLIPLSLQTNGPNSTNGKLISGLAFDNMGNTYQFSFRYIREIGLLSYPIVLSQAEVLIAGTGYHVNTYRG